jgi:hypothetical protein
MGLLSLSASIAGLIALRESVFQLVFMYTMPISAARSKTEALKDEI